MSTSDNFQWYELTPCDAWFFRDGRPMNRGEDARGVKSLFPPSAETLVGAFRATLARSQGWPGRGDWPRQIKDVLGDGFDQLGKLSFLGPIMSKDGVPLFPCPRHLLLRNEEPESWLTLSEPATCDLGSSIRLPVPPIRDNAAAALTDSDGHFLTLSGFQRVLNGDLPKAEEMLKASDLYVFETRVGISRDEQTRTVGADSLYNPTFVRLRQGVGLLVGLSGLPRGWEVPSLLAVGGESRMARCTPIKDDPLKDISNVSKGGLLLSITPVLSPSQEWYGPGPGGQLSALESRLQVQVESIACERPVLVPGWDSLKGHPRDQLLAIPPGTVWWLSNPDSTSGIRQIGERRRHGYGLVISAATPKV